jgi:uncharacterized membrane protein
MTKNQKKVAALLVIGVLLLITGTLASIYRALLFGSFINSYYGTVSGVIIGTLSFAFGLVGLAKAANNAQTDNPSKNIVMPCISVLLAIFSAGFSIHSIGLSPYEFFSWATWGLI